MNFKYILLVFVYILSNVSTATIPSKRESCKGKVKKINVVLFFSSTGSCDIPKEAEGMKALKMHEVAKVKSSIPGEHGVEQASETTHSPPCKELLKESLTSLVHFCQNVLGMRTAVVSVSNAEITNDISNAEPDVPPEIRERQIAQNGIRETNRNNVKLSMAHQSARAPDIVNLRNIITSPEHTEVFRIKVKRELPELEQPGEIVDIPLEKEGKKSPWDVLDILSHVRYSFFGKLLQDEAKTKLNEEENKIAADLTKNKEDPGLFETVKTTLSTLQEHTGGAFLLTIFGGHMSEISNSDSPLVLSIKHVIESTDPKDTLIVATSACPEHHHEPPESEEQLEHIGRSCVHGHGHGICQHGHAGEHVPEHAKEASAEHKHGLEFRRQYDRHRKREEEAGAEVVNIEEGGHKEHHENATIPIFAKGPEYLKLAQCTLLFDVPVIIKGILEQFALAFEGNKT